MARFRLSDYSGVTQSGLHSEKCEIDYKLHSIIGGRKRCVVQTIQEDTGTNIYFPSPFSGVLGPKNQALLSKQNFIFITGEFFGVQRARDMLFQVSLHKVRRTVPGTPARLPCSLLTSAEQMHHFARHGDPAAQARLDAQRPTRGSEADHARQRHLHQLPRARVADIAHLGVRRPPGAH